MSAYHAIFSLSLILSSLAFIKDDLSDSVIPFVAVSNLPETSDYIREIIITDNEYGVPPSKYQLGCRDDATLSFYNPTNAYTVTGTDQSDYQAMCVGSSTVESCIAYKGEEIVSISDGSTISSITTFDELKAVKGNSVIFTGQLTETNIYDDAALSDIKTVYEALKDYMSTLYVSSSKLAAGGDFGDGGCLDRFHRWSMYLSKAYSTEISDSKWDGFTDDASCIAEATRSNGQRPSDITNPSSICPNANSKASTRASSAAGGGRRLLYSYSKSQIEAFLAGGEYCPDGYSTSNSCNNPNFGRCGAGSDCWDWVCGIWSYNTSPGITNDGCGCNNGCFEHDYSCSCQGDFSVGCWLPFVVLYNGACHAGTTTIDVIKMENIQDVNFYYGGECADCGGWGCSCRRGEPYVEIEPKNPDYIGHWENTEHAGTDYAASSYVFSSTDGGNMYWPYRFDDFWISIWDYDSTSGDDKMWETVIVTNEATTTAGTGINAEPKITFSIDKRGY